MNRIIATSLVSALLSLSALAPRPAPATVLVTMAWRPVGNPGNAADSTGYGAVAYSYNIGTYDVTNSQYVAFLNSNDWTGADPLALYNTGMSIAGYGGINYISNAAFGSKYGVISGDGNNPVNYVTWFDAVRFANWMDNGQPVFSTEPTATNNATETGAYTLSGFTPTPSNANSITRNAGASIFLPSENEWYKAAYYNFAGGSYFEYPTSSNTAPNATGPTATPNSANYDDVVNTVTNVGAYSGTTSPYGAADMGGDVFQWNDTAIPVTGETFRGLRGGSFSQSAIGLKSSVRNDADPTPEENDFGFRLASVPGVPEPSTGVLAVLACGAALWWRKRSPISSRHGRVRTNRGTDTP